MSHGQGEKAILNGQIAKANIEEVFTKKGIRVFCYNDITNNPCVADNQLRYVVKDYPFTSIYENKSCIDFMLYDRCLKKSYCIISKSQESSGSASRKLPYVFFNAKSQFPEGDIIFILEGEGFEKGAKNWFQKEINDFNSQHQYQMHLMNIEQFKIWFNNMF